MAEAYGHPQFAWDPEVDLKAYPLWIYDTAHTPVPWKPLGFTHWLAGTQIGLTLAPEKQSAPYHGGLDARIKDGYYLLATVEPKEEEIPAREKAYRETLRPMIEDFQGEWNKMIEEWLPVVNRFKERCHPERLRGLNDVELFELLEDYELNCHRLCWVRYMEWFFAPFDLYGLFVDLCEKLLKMDMEDPTFKKLMGGFDTIEFRLNKELWRLGDRAKELGLGQLFLATEDNEELMSKLDTSEQGRRWLEEYRKFINVYGWKGSAWVDCSAPTWVEKPSLVLRDIKVGMSKEGVFPLDAQRERLIKERGEAEKEVLAKVPSEQREWFEKLMKVAEMSSWIQEEHAVLTIFQDQAIARHLFIEFGRRFARSGAIDDPEDVFFLIMPEIKKYFLPRHRFNIRPLVNRHREEWEKNLKAKIEPFIGDPAYLETMLRKNPTMRLSVVTPRIRPELKADLYGATWTPGVVEGVARIIFHESELDQVKPGEILVAICTNSHWTPVFGIISGIVTDTGGSLSHPAIVAREYGLPGVFGTMEATKKIKTGDRIKVDGDLGIVHILR